MAKIFMNEKKIESLLKLARERARDYALFHVALATGFRAGDLLSLKRWDVAPNVGDDIQPVLKIKMQKTGKMVERALPLACREAIRSYLETRIDDNPYLFCSESNNLGERQGPMNRSSLHRIYKSYLGRLYTAPAELRGNACHVTRRSVAKLISDKAGRIEPASKFLGHTSIANTVSYLDMDAYGRQADEIVQALPWNETR